MTGETLSLWPLVASDLAALYVVARDPLVWEQHPQPERAERSVLDRSFEASLSSSGALVVTENGAGCVVESSLYYERNPEVSEIGIGYSFFARDLWGMRANT